MKKFEYLQVEYSKYPSPEELNEEGIDGWELIIISTFYKTFINTDSLCSQKYYSEEIYIATFKRELEL